MTNHDYTPHTQRTYESPQFGSYPAPHKSMIRHSLAQELI